MAESWLEWLNGTPEQKAASFAEQQKQFDAIAASRPFRNAVRAHTRGYDDGMTDPRAYAMSLVQDQLSPSRPSDAYDTMASAFDYVVDVGGRPRDTLVRSVQEATSGNPLQAAALAARAIPSAVVPSLAAGSPGDPDDWRKHAGPAQGLVIDLLTDPMNYPSLGIRPLLKYGGKAVRAADNMRSVPAFLLDASGNDIRTLLNATPHATR